MRLKAFAARPVLYLLALVGAFAFAANAVDAGEADVVGADVRKTGNGEYHFSVRVRHDDKGWDHYADKWDVVGPDGTVLGTRILHHPHENEQPFTRSLGNVRIPDEVDSVTLRAHDKVHEFGGKEVTVTLPR